MRIAPLLMAVFMVSAGIARACDLPTALAKWKDGDIEDALICTRSVEPSKAKDEDSKSALLMVIAFVKGQYRESIEHYRAISRDSPNFKSTAETSMPFYLWFDHYMFAKGSLDVHSNLNFFVDSGVANVRRGRQAALRTATSTLRSFGYTEKELSRPFVDLHGALGLGTLRQDGLLAIHDNDFDPASFGGITIHGMISHAFLERYVWTIDFENRTYGFSK